MSFKKDLHLLLQPFYWVNILLSLSYVMAKKFPILCNIIFPAAECELDSVSRLLGKMNSILRNFDLFVVIYDEKIYPTQICSHIYFEVHFTYVPLLSVNSLENLVKL